MRHNCSWAAPTRGVYPSPTPRQAHRLQRSCPISTNGLFAAQDVRRLSHDLDDERRGKLKIIGVVRQNTVEVATVPGCDPFSREVFCKGLVNHGAPRFVMPNAARERRAEAARSAEVASPTRRAC